MYLVIGVSKGSIGDIVATELLKSGEQVVCVHAPWENPALTTAMEVSARAHFLSVNLNETRMMPGDLVDRVLRIGAQTLGSPRLKGVAYCAGYNRMAPVRELDNELWEQTLWLNMGAVVQVVQELLAAKDDGRLQIFSQDPLRFVILGSNTAYVARRNSAAYAASKAGVVHLSKSLDRELAHEGLRFTTVDPGTVMATAMTEQTLQQMVQLGLAEDEAAARDLLLKNVPGNTPTYPWDVARVVAFVLTHNLPFGGNSIRMDAGQQQG